MRVLTLSFHWLLVIFFFVLIVGCNYFGFDFNLRCPIEKLSAVNGRVSSAFLSYWLSFFISL